MQILWKHLVLKHYKLDKKVFSNILAVILPSKQTYMKHLKIKIDKLEFFEETILKDIDFVINATDRISIVGNNGSGKTTLMKTIIGEITQYEGFIENVWNLTLGYLHQIYSDNEEKTVREELKEGFLDIIKKEKEMQVMEGRMAEEPENMTLVEEYTILLEQFSVIGWYDYENKVHGVANGMGILELIDKKLSEVSGWERTKIALAKILLESPDILFLDEPTNFIDMASVEWLESYLQNKWTGWYVVISHDREFLDKTCSKTYEVQPGRWMTYYHSNYSQYVKERERVEKKKIDEFARQDDYIAKQKQLINRFRAGSRAWWAKSREKMIERMDVLTPPYIPRKPKFFFNYSNEWSEKALSFREVFIGRKEPLFFIQEAILYKGQRVWIVWENGAGKSTMLKTIMREIDILDGFMSVWKSSQIIYYSQMHEWLYSDLTIKQNFEKHGAYTSDQHLIWYLSHFLFEKWDIDKTVKNLSGWERAKLLFSLIGQKECNFLIMDEPTNHLDYDTREQLEKCLSDFPGTILFISHDRYFVNKLSTHIWFIEWGELSISYGNYGDYKYKLKNGIDMDMSLFDEEAQLNLALSEKVWEAGMRKIKNKFKNGKKRK